MHVEQIAEHVVNKNILGVKQFHVQEQTASATKRTAMRMWPRFNTS